MSEIRERLLQRFITSPYSPWAAGIMLLIAAAAYRLAFVGDDPNNWTGIVSTLVSVLGAICLGYSGFATWADIKKGDKDE